MESSLRVVCYTVRIGKMMIFSDGKEVQYEDIPFKLNLGERFILLVSPMLNSGKACETAIARLLDSSIGFHDDRVFVLSMLVAPQAVKLIFSRFTNVRLIVAAVDNGVDANGMVFPGIGDFATRYFGNE